MSLDSFAGNTQVKQTLAGMTAQGRMGHAILLEGEPGLGKKTLARLIAAAVLCNHPTDKPCLTCAHCRKVLAGFHPDVTEIAGGTSARSFHIDHIRNLRKDAYLLPNEGARRIFILSGADTMTVQAQNALLKILEEPPDTVMIILTASSKERMLSTILSRVTSLALAPVPADSEGIRVILKHHPEVSEQTAKQSLIRSNGNIGSALVLLGGKAADEEADLISGFCQALLSPNEIDLLKLTAKFENKKELFSSFLGVLPAFFRDAVALQNGADVLLSETEPQARVLSSKLTAGRLLNLMDICEQLSRAIDQNANHTLLITRFCARMRTAAMA